MNVSIERVDTAREDRVLMAMIVSTDFLSRMERTIDLYAFSKPGRTVASWCLDYYKTYDKAPGNDLNIMFDSDLVLKDEDRTFISGLLTRISGMVDSQFNVEYYVDQAIDFFKTKKLQKLAGQIQNHLVSGHTDEAENLVVEYMKVEKEETTGINLFTDTERLKVRGMSERNILFTPPGAFGEMTGPIRRQDFFMYVGKGKSGKTQLLQQHGIWAAVNNGLRVLHLSLEMSEEEVTDRYYSAFTGLPLTRYKGNDQILVPFFSDEGTIEYQMYRPELMETGDVLAKADDLRMMSRGGCLIVESRPQWTFSVRDLGMLLDKYETVHNITFDVVIVDYADLLKASNTRLEFRHQVNDIFVGLRGMSQERNIAIITVSQGNRESYKKDTEAAGVSEDIRKLATVTGAFAINQTDAEKEASYWRMSPMVMRHSFFNETDTVICLNCLSVARMVMDSRWSGDTRVMEAK